MNLTDNKPRASEGGHWYDRDGTPRYEVPTADGRGVRSATLRDARKFGWYPGVTSIIKCLAAPQLENWQQEQVLMSALTLTRLPTESDKDFCARIIRDSQEQGRKARDRGTEIHAALQGHHEGKPPSEEMWPFVQGTLEVIRANCGPQTWTAEKPVAHPTGFGTKADLSCVEIILDFKGKDFTEADAPKLKTWDDHDMQLAATRKALGHDAAMNCAAMAAYESAACAIVYVSRTVPGLARLCWIDEPELMRGWEMFKGLHHTWKAKNKYWPELWQDKVAA